MLHTDTSEQRHIHTHTLKLKPIFAKPILMFQTLQTLALFKQPAHLAASTKTYLKHILHSLSVVLRPGTLSLLYFLRKFRLCFLIEAHFTAASGDGLLGGLPQDNMRSAREGQVPGGKSLRNALFISKITWTAGHSDTVKKRRFVWEINFGSRSGLP